MLTNHCISFGSVGNATRDIGQHLRNQVKRLKGLPFPLTGSRRKRNIGFQVNLRDLFFSQAWHESSNYQCTLSWKCYLPVAFLKGKSLLTVVSGHLWKGWTNDRFLLYKTFLCRRLTDRFDLRLVQVLWMIRVNGSATLVVESGKTHQTLIQLKTWSFRNNKTCERSQWHGNWWVRHSFKETGLQKHINS